MRRPAAEKPALQRRSGGRPRFSQIVLETIQSTQGPESSFKKRTPHDRTPHRSRRVSTRDQNLDLQLDALKKSGCDRIFEDTISGTKSRRPGLAQALDTLRDGDTLVAWKLDRLGRSVKDLLDFAVGLNERGISFVSLTDAIDTTTVSGRFFFNVMASLAQMERELMIERT